MERPGIAVIDNGGQLTHTIRDRLTKIGVYTELFDPEKVDMEDLANARGVVLSGGPHSVYAEGSPRFAPRLDGDLADLDVPILGICYGLQDVADHYGGAVPRESTDGAGEYGEAELEIEQRDVLFDRIDPDEITVWMSHGDFVTSLPDDWIVIGRTDDCGTAAVRHESADLYGVQFHPEAEHTR
ncbi:MAG: gamma-glutamyl-gamma-aminobutyrate hydrolase family protein, partial [Candidatus Nanohaloarchaea archaeon]